MIYNGQDIDKLVEELKQELFKVFPDCGENYTIMIYLWTDGDFKIECRHGRFDGPEDVLHIFTHYKNEIEYVGLTNINGAATVDKNGNWEYDKIN